MKVLIVGQNPSKTNSNPNIPFIGTKSNITLEKWMNELEVKSDKRTIINVCSNVEFKVSKVQLADATLNVKIINSLLKPSKVIALGNVASIVLNKAKINHFKLPHPSPKNRKLNDKKWLNNELRKAREYLCQK